MSDNTLKRKIDDEESAEPLLKRVALDENDNENPHPDVSSPVQSPRNDGNDISVPLDSLNEQDKKESEDVSLQSATPSADNTNNSPPTAANATENQSKPSPPSTSPSAQSPYSRSLVLGQLDSLINAYNTKNPSDNSQAPSAPNPSASATYGSSQPLGATNYGTSQPQSATNYGISQPATANYGASQQLGVTNYGASRAYEPVPFASHLDYTSKPVPNHQADRELDPTYVSFRMYCPVKEASYVIGKRGDMINHLREKASARIQVSENIKDVQERIILVRGPAENVAKAFGLITRAILEEPEDEPASIMSRQYNLKVLIPHPMVGYIIGKLGSKFREIEENSAAKLKAAEQPLPNSTDRILSILGVADAIHIAIYYISQVIIEHKDILKKHNIVYYAPGNQPPVNTMGSLPGSTYGNTNMIGNGPMQGGAPPQRSFDYGRQARMAAPVHNQPSNPVPTQQYTDEHGNTMIGNVITSTPVPTGTGNDKFSEDVFVANVNIGSVIGKGGNNIKQIRESSGCSYVKIEPDQHQTVMLGGGRGLTSIRRLTLTGSLSLIQTAIYLINQRIMADQERNM